MVRQTLKNIREGITPYVPGKPMRPTYRQAIEYLATDPNFEILPGDDGAYAIDGASSAVCTLFGVDATQLKADVDARRKRLGEPCSL